jgi:hypothetical protein
MGMTDVQLYIAVGLPVFAFLVNITRFDTLTDKVVDIDNRLTRVEERLLRS